LLAAASLLWLALGCAGEEDKKSEYGEPGPVDSVTGVAEADFDWRLIAQPLVDFFYEPDDSLIFKANRLADKIDEVYVTITYALQWDDPPRIKFYCYRDTTSFRLYTSRGTPFWVGDEFYYGYGPNFGPLIAHYVFEKFPGGDSKWEFLNEGLPVLLDFSGRNYHQASFNFLVDARLASVAELTSESAYEQLNESKRQIEAASFAGFLYEQYGPDTVMQLYHSDAADFETAASEILDASIVELNETWIEYLPQHTTEAEQRRQAERNLQL
jgi:hypothetical protein